MKICTYFRMTCRSLHVVCILYKRMISGSFSVSFALFCSIGIILLVESSTSSNGFTFCLGRRRRRCVRPHRANLTYVKSQKSELDEKKAGRSQTGCYDWESSKEYPSGDCGITNRRWATFQRGEPLSVLPVSSWGRPDDTSQRNNISR